MKSCHEHKYAAIVWDEKKISDCPLCVAEKKITNSVINLKNCSAVLNPVVEHVLEELRR